MWALQSAARMMYCDGVPGKLAFLIYLCFVEWLSYNIFDLEMRRDTCQLTHQAVIRCQESLVSRD